MSLPRFLIALSALFLPAAALAQDAAPPPPPAAAATVPAIVAPPVTPDTSRPITRGELPALVREILLNDPEIIRDAVQKLREKQEAEAKKKTSEAMAKYKAELYSDPNSPSIGDAKAADITIVEFFDYHCGYCKRMLPTIAQLANEDKKLRIVFKEYPILSEDSVTASRAALAVNRIAPDKYFAFHSALMKHEGKFDEKVLADLAKPLGIAADKLKTEMAKPEITAELDKVRQMGGDLGISGTPSIIIADTLIPGAVPYEELKKAIANVRAGKEPLAEEAPAAAAPAESAKQ